MGNSHTIVKLIKIQITEKINMIWTDMLKIMMIIQGAISVELIVVIALQVLQLRKDIKDDTEE